MTEVRVPFADSLAAAVSASGSVVCLGLDPRKASLPAPIGDQVTGNHPDQWAAAYTQFCREVIDVAAGKVACVKPQVAFFEQLGPAGSIALAEVIRYARQNQLLVIVDAKRNDIGSTAQAYADAYLGAESPWGGDALTVSPYLGEDSLQPFVDFCDQRDAGIFVLVKTSNPGGGFLQDRQSDGAKVYETVAELVQKFNEPRAGKSGYGPVGAVVGATYPDQLAQLRSAMPSAWILIPGFGAQGGGPEDVKPGFDENRLGAVVNSSRHLIFAHQRPEFCDKFGDQRWQEAVDQAIEQMNQQLRG